MSPLIRVAMMAALFVLLLAAFIPNYLQSRQVRSLNECVDFNLPALARAKERWAREHNKKAGDTPTQEELLPYLENHRWPGSSGGCRYVIGPVGKPPACSIESHPWNPNPLPDHLLRR